MLTTLIGFFKHGHLRERFCAVCLVGPSLKYRQLFKNFTPRYQDWRWSSLISCLQDLSKLRWPLVLLWDSARMEAARKSGSARAQAQPPPDIDPARPEGAFSAARQNEADACDDTHAVGDVINSVMFWAFGNMLLLLSSGV